MMRRVFALLSVITLLPLGAAAQNENIQVEGQNTLTGFWKITVPSSTHTSNMVSFEFGEMRERYCRLDQKKTDLSFYCLSENSYRKGSGTADGRKLHLAWGSMMARSVIDAPLNSMSEFQGIFAFKLSGIPHTAPNPSVGTKLTYAMATVDKAGKAGLVASVLGELAMGGIQMPHGDAVASNIGGDVELNTPDEIRAFGNVEAVTYLGEGSRPRGKFSPPDHWSEPPFVYALYAVEFTNGQRLCGIHQRDDGVLGGFLCV